MPTKKPAKALAPQKKSEAVALDKQSGETEDQAIARNVASGTVSLGAVAIDYFKPRFGGLDIPLNELAQELVRQGKEVNGGDLSRLERTLTAQAVTLNAIFTELARRSALNMGEYLDASERYMRLALKAQSQCRATVESLAAIKNPPIVYARQANIANGPQQVNNGVTENKAKTMGTVPYAGEYQSAPIELLEESHGERLDYGTQGASGGTHQNLEAVGAVNGAEDE